MKMRLSGSIGILALVMTLSLMASSAPDDVGRVLNFGPAARLVQAVAADRSALPRTPWGHADLQGTWTSEAEIGVPFERPAEFGSRQQLTDEEYAARLKQSQVQAEGALDEIDVFTADTSNAGAVGSATSPPPHWLERSTASRRTSL